MEDDNKWCVGVDLEGGRCILSDSTIVEFTLRDQGKPQKNSEKLVG